MKILIKDIRLTKDCGFGKNPVNILTDGKIISYIGEFVPDVRADRVIDGKGNLVLPAFYNAHCHSSMTLFRGYGDDLPLDRWLNERIFPAEDRLDEKSVYIGSMVAIAEMIRNGIVSFSDMYMFMDSVACAVRDCKVKANLARSIVSFDPDIDMKNDFRMKEAADFAKRWHGECDGKIKVDMSLHAEYTNVAKCCEYVADYAAKNGYLMQVHASETKKEHDECIERHGVTPIRFFSDTGVFDVPATAAHCVWADDEDIEILARKSVTVAHNPVSNLKLASGVMPYVKMKKAGVNIALGTDGAASNNRLDILREMQFAALIHKGTQLDAAATDASDMIYMATRAGALAQGRRDCGKIETGYAADLLMIDLHSINNIPNYDYESAVCYSVGTSDIVLTMCDGCILYENGAYTSIDTERLEFEMKQVLENYFV